MSGQPDPKPEPRVKRSRRGRDGGNRTMVKQTMLGDRECWGCGREGANGHHLIPRDFALRGPNLPWNIVPLCGSGTSECHGAFHGNPYTTASGERITPTLVRARIVARLIRDRARLREVWDFLDSSELRYRYFVRLLGMPHRDLDEMQRRYFL